jgi:MscS family membrane protein
MNLYPNRHVKNFSLRLMAAICLACIVMIAAGPVWAAEEVDEKAGNDSTVVELTSPSAESPAPPEPLLDLADFFPEPLRREVLGVAIWQFVAAFSFILLGFVAKKISDYVLEKKVIAFLRGTRVDFDHMLVEAAGRPAGMLLLILGMFGACAVLSIKEELVSGIFRVCVVADAVWFLFRLVDVASEYLGRLSKRSESTLDDQLVPLLRKTLKVTVALIGAVTAMTAVGINVTGLVAGLGIGGLAVALGLQDTLANFFGSVFIFIDRPFSIGDHIQLGDVEGTVTEVGFRSTRILTFPKTIVTIPNKTVANATIDNVSERPIRRVLQTIGLKYETTADQMEKAVETIRNIVSSDDGVDPEFIVVKFDEFADFSLNIMVYYFTTATGLVDHKSTKERINLAIMRALDALDLAIAFPTQTVHFEGDIAKRMADAPPPRA